MIGIQKQYRTYLKDVVTQLQLIEIDASQQEKLIENIRDTELIVPVVGGFSAGKSTLINSWLDDEVLSTNLTPETALATELRYSVDSYIEAVKPDGSFDKFKLDQSEDIKHASSEYQYLKLYLNHEKLKSVEPLVLVDMPGFDSPLELHNAAIMNYLNKGIYFIVLTSIEDGNLTKSTLRELENMAEFGKDFSFCLSKANLKSDEDVASVKDRIQEQLGDYLEFNKRVIPLYENGGKELNKILTDIDEEKLFEKIFKQELKYNYLEVESSINTIISTLKTSKEDVINALLELQNSIKKIISKKEKMIEEAKLKYSDNSVEAIINGVSRELMTNQESLVQMALSNQEAFSQEMSQIVKNTLIYQVKTQLNEVSSDMLNDFSIEIKDLGNTISSFEFGDEWIDTISKSTSILLKNAQNGLNDLVSARKDKQSDNSGDMYKIITGTLAITTSVISPILEVVILLLPEIISFFSGQSKEAKMKQDMYTKFSTEIIPSIKTKIRAELPNLFDSQINTIINTISDKFEEQLQQKEQEIKQAQEEKEKSIEDIETKLVELEEIKQNVKQLATNTLYGD